MPVHQTRFFKLDISKSQCRQIPRQDLLYQKKVKCTSSPELIYFTQFAMRYPVCSTHHNMYVDLQTINTLFSQQTQFYKDISYCKVTSCTTFSLADLPPNLRSGFNIFSFLSEFDRKCKWFFRRGQKILNDATIQ